MRFKSLDRNTRSVRMLREAMHGRVSKPRARHNLRAADGDLRRAAEMFFQEREAQLSSWPSREDVIKDLESKFSDRTEFRMFACEDCDIDWWYKVPTRKPVSKCRKCMLKYDAIPRYQEYGWCSYHCRQCDRNFSGYGVMGSRTESPCYGCGRYVCPSRVNPPEKKGGRRSSSDHSCTGNNCCNRARGRAKGPCVHPRSTRKRVVIASRRHVSTGSTVDTFLSQNEADATPFRSSLSDIEEEG